MVFNIRSRHPYLILLVLVLLVAAVLRIANLSHVPAGLNWDEISNIQGAETVSRGMIASFYNVGDPLGGHEGLYPVAQAIITALLGSGLFCYRVLSVFCGMVSVALMFALARRLFGNFIGLAAMITLTVTFWPVLLSRSVNRETLLLPLILALLYVFTRALHLTREVEPDPPMTVPYMALGVFIALTAYTHWTGLLITPLILLFVFYLVRTRQAVSRRIFGFLGFALLVALILLIPYLAFTARVPGLSGLHVYWINRPDNLLDLVGSTLKTLLSIGFAGDSSPLHNVPYNALLGPLGVIFLLIGLVHAIRNWRAPNMMLMLLTLVIGLVPDMWSRQSPSFANMIVALPAIMALTGVGASIVVQYVWKSTDLFHKFSLQLATTVVVAVSAGIVALMLFGVWMNNSQVDEAYHGQLGRLATFLDHTTDGLTTTICTYNLRPGDDTTQISDPALIDLMMHHDDNRIRFSNCVDGFILTAGGGPQRIAYADPKTPSSVSPIFSPWLAGAQPIVSSAISPNSIVQINVEKKLADALGKLTLRHAAWSTDASGDSTVTLPVRMGGYLTFEGYSLDSERIYKPSDTVTVVTYWRADGNQLPDLRIFTHILRNPDTEPVLQNDILSVDSSLLGNRDVFIQIVTIPLPPDFPPGDYYVSVGAYSEATGERLPIFDKDQPRGDRLFLDTIKVQP